MSDRITVNVLAERLSAHADAFDKRCEHDDKQRNRTHEKLDGLAREVRDGLNHVHGRIDGLRTCGMRFIIGLAGTLIMLLLGIVAYLLANGAPWQHVTP